MSEPSVVFSRPVGNRSLRASLRADPPCIDLAEPFGRRFRVEYEESYCAQYGPNSRINDPWLKIIPCRTGHICPWGGSTLAAVTDKAGPIARKLAALPGVKLWQDGSDGVTVLFDIADFEAVARIMYPRRRRSGTSAVRDHLSRVGAKTRFQDGVGSRGKPRISTQTALVDLEAGRAGSAVSMPCGAHLES